MHYIPHMMLFDVSLMCAPLWDLWPSVCYKSDIVTDVATFVN